MYTPPSSFRRALVAAFVVAAALAPAAAQRRLLHAYTHSQGTPWDVPVLVDDVDSISAEGGAVARLLLHTACGIGVPLSADVLDSLAFADATAEEAETKDPYQVFRLYVTTAGARDVTTKDYYTACYVSLGARGSFSDYSAPAQIRGRGNSSLLWYDKKPFRLKLDTKHKLLGLGKAKSWVLLANYRDVTDMMNTFVFETGRWLGLPYTNHTRYVELFMNGDYRGVYQLTEQVQQHQQRVAVSADRGILIALDVDDGPAESSFARDNFTSPVFHMPVSVKYPDNEHFTANTVDSVKALFRDLEQAINKRNFTAVKNLLDVSSFIKYLQLQELVYNVELSAPRSIYMHKDGDGPWTMGPLWDFDAGYDFDWSNMYTGHTYFTSYRETVMGTDPLHRNGEYPYVPRFFTNLFGNAEFVRMYKEQWLATKDSIVSHGWAECEKYAKRLRSEGAMARETARWPVRGKTFDAELQKMHQWLLRRADYLTQLIADIPEP